jgi:hypothetical protein
LKYERRPKMRYLSKLTAPFLVVFLLFVTSLACGGGTSAPTQIEQAASPTIPTAEEHVETQLPSASEATSMPRPTDTPPPTDTPEPTDTPPPTDTPEPTDTPPPTDTPEPIDTPLPTNTPELTQTPLPLGETVSFADWDYLVDDAKVMTTVGDKVPRGAYIVTLVQVTNNGTTERDVGGQFFVAQDTQGRLYEMDTDASLEYHHAFKTDAWYLDDVGPAATAVIPVVFDVSPDASGVVLLTAGSSGPAIILVEDVGGEPLELPGAPFGAADWAFVVAEVSTASSIGDEIARGQYVIVIVAVRNDALTPRDIGSSFFVIEDGQGRVYEMDTDASLEYHHTFKTDAWHLETLGPSLIGTIALVFDVSPDATQLALDTKPRGEESVLVLGAVGGEEIQLSGEVYSSGNWEFTTKEVSTATSIGDEVAEGRFLIVLCQVKNLAFSEQQLGSRAFTLKDAQGRTYKMDTDASLEYHHTFRTDAWHLEDIGPSLTGTVPVVFDVATDASGFLLVMQDGSEVPLPQAK